MHPIKKVFFIFLSKNVPTVWPPSIAGFDPASTTQGHCRDFELTGSKPSEENYLSLGK